MNPMDQDDASLLVMMAVRKSAGRSLAMFGEDVQMDPVEIASQLRRDLGDEQLREVVSVFEGHCENGCNDPVSCRNVTITAIQRWLKRQNRLAAKNQQELWAGSTN